MADTKAIALLESVYVKTDKQIREIVAQIPPPVEVDTINLIIGDGTNVLSTGIQGALRVDFKARITGVFLQEIDAVTGSVELDILKAQGGTSPSFTSIVASAPPEITTSRFSADSTLTGWTTEIARGDYLRFDVTSVTAFTRLVVALRIRRLEP